MCLLMWVRKPLSNNLTLNYRYRKKTSWTYWTFALHRLTLTTTVNTTSSCMEQPRGLLFLSLSQKLRCNTWRDAPLQPADKRYRFGYAALRWRQFYRRSQRRNWHCTNYFQRLTLKSWYTNLEQTRLNRCQPLPAPYKRLIHDVNETDKRTSTRPT